MKNLSKIFFILTACALISCGNEKKQEEEETFRIGDQNRTESTTDTNETNRSQSTAAEDGDVVEITLSANDQMRFDKNELRVKSGQTVRLILRHTGQMAENVMGHNFVLLEEGTDVSEFGQEAARAQDNDYIPANSENVIAHTEMIGGGETTTIEFEAPAAGTYDFICSFPGHYALMQGKFIVE